MYMHLLFLRPGNFHPSLNTRKSAAEFQLLWPGKPLAERLLVSPFRLEPFGKSWDLARLGCQKVDFCGTMTTGDPRNHHAPGRMRLNLGFWVQPSLWTPGTAGQYAVYKSSGSSRSPLRHSMFLSYSALAFAPFFQVDWSEPWS